MWIQIISFDANTLNFPSHEISLKYKYKKSAGNPTDRLMR